MVVVRVCEGYVDSAVFYVADLGDKSMISWSHDGSVTDFAAWPLAGDREWRLARPLPAWKAGWGYAVYGATHDNRWSGTRVECTPGDLGALRPGQVRYQPFAADSPKTTSLASFQEHACDSAH